MRAALRSQASRGKAETDSAAVSAFPHKRVTTPTTISRRWG